MNTLNTILLTAAAAPFLFAGWSVYLRWRVPVIEEAEPFAQPGNIRPGVSRMGFEAETLDLSVMLRSVGASLESLARSRFAKILLAVNPGYMVRADRSALQMTLSETIATAVRAAPGGQVLISVRQLGPQLNVLITDDGADADQKLRESMVRGAGELLALQGGTISVEARPGRGTTVTLRLPVFAGSASGATAASGFDAPGRARAGHSVEPAGGYVMAEDALSDYELVLAS